MLISSSMTDHEVVVWQEKKKTPRDASLTSTSCQTGHKHCGRTISVCHIHFWANRFPPFVKIVSLLLGSYFGPFSIGKNDPSDISSRRQFIKSGGFFSGACQQTHPQLRPLVALVYTWNRRTHVQATNFSHHLFTAVLFQTNMTCCLLWSKKGGLFEEWQQPKTGTVPKTNQTLRQCAETSPYIVKIVSIMHFGALKY